VGIRLDPDRCRGCLRCELACSWRRSGRRLFQPSLSSTRVLRSNEDRSVTMTIDATCDGCAGERTPLCVEACVFGARRVER
jgi:Fe-S-cluster-containing dehydrogenase component